MKAAHVLNGERITNSSLQARQRFSFQFYRTASFELSESLVKAYYYLFESVIVLDRLSVNEPRCYNHPIPLLGQKIKYHFDINLLRIFITNSVYNLKLTRLKRSDDSFPIENRVQSHFLQNLRYRMM